MGLLQEVRRAWDGILSPMFGEFATEVLVQDVDVPGTAKDPVYDEAEGAKVFTAPVAVLARVRLGKSRQALDAGEAEDADGTLTARTDELSSKGVSLDPGARILFGGQRFVVVRREARAQVGEDFLLIRATLRREGP